MASINSSNSNFVFCAPLPGKTDTHSLCNDAQKCKRVKQSPQPPNVCFLYAIKIIRDDQRIGKHPITAKQISDRKFEKSISNFFKNTFPSIKVVSNENIQNIELLENFISTYSTEESLDSTLNVYHLDKNQKNLDLYAFYRGFLQEIMLEKFNFSYAPWSINSSIYDLIKSLRENGPHIICGFFGAGELNTVVERIKDKNHQETFIYDRPLYTRRFIQNDEHPRAHAIVIVGAESRYDSKQQQRAYVYYIDPRDGSDITLESQKVYVMSYEKLVKNVIALNGDDHPDQLKDNFHVAAYLKKIIIFFKFKYQSFIHIR